MKKILAAALAILCLTATAALAQMGRMGPPQADRMMNEDMMRDMSGMMGQMNEMMQKMTGVMEHRERMDYPRRADLSTMMGEMSQIMQEMSGQMAQHRMEPARMRHIRERVNHLNDMMRRL